jgi:hypothetical protein
MRMPVKIALGALVVFGAMQLVRFDRTNPPVTADLRAPPPVLGVLRRACYDCHSNETVWPWYSDIAAGADGEGGTAPGDRRLSRGRGDAALVLPADAPVGSTVGRRQEHPRRLGRYGYRVTSSPHPVTSSLSLCATICPPWIVRFPDASAVTAK